MKTDEIRERFLNFFKNHGHKIIKSDSLVPENDPTLLFTGAGMNQFKEYFLGLKKDLKRATSSQKCLRTGDLDEVGRTPYHHSFFEMLGNFSFGDYFKKEAIQWAWEFLTEDLKLPKERLRVSVHQKDDEAYKIWRDQIKIREGWIYKMGDKSNFWPANAPAEGPNGPCGPCSEIYYDQEPDSKSEDIETSRFAEIWNLVFTQYDRQEGGKLVPLAAKNIDTGMGLERLACVMQKKKTNFEIDIFVPINQAIEDCLRSKIQGEVRKDLYAVSDHLRAVVFAIADGVIPSNEGRGYVVRKLIRRAIWRSFEVNPNKKGAEIFLKRVVPVVISVMSSAYPELKAAEKHIIDVVDLEENRFSDTVTMGREMFLKKLDELKIKGVKKVPGEVVFELYDTYGFPEETTRLNAEKLGFSIDQDEFYKLMKEQRKRSKKASQISGSIFVTTELEKKMASLPPSKFLGYQTLESKAKILLTETKDGRGVIVLDETPFYAESGGQVGDQGILKGKSFEARVVDTQKKDKFVLHHVEISKGVPKIGDEVTAAVDRDRRERAMRNHTATHLLHAALRNILGNQVRQLGSLVAPEKLRFDYSYVKPLTPEELKKIEDLVNSEILKDTALTKEEKPTEEAKKEGAIAFFGEKYGDSVRVVSVAGFSKEFCGGTHCERTGQIGIFVITSDSAIASGVRRIEALTGEAALEYVQASRAQLRLASERLKSSISEIPDRIERLQEKIKQMEKGSGTVSTFNSPNLIESTPYHVGQYACILYRVDGTGVDRLRQMYYENVRPQPENAIWCFGSIDGNKANFFVGASGDLAHDPSLNMSQIANYLGQKVEGSGGGKVDFAMGGTSNLVTFNKEWNQFPYFIEVKAQVKPR